MTNLQRKLMIHIIILIMLPGEANKDM